MPILSLLFRSLTLLVFLGGFAAQAGTPIYEVGNRAQGWSGKGTSRPHDTFLDEVQPIFTKRCVACHGCYEAPCQANFQSYEGILRGFNPEPIYGSRRTRPTYPTRMKDASTLAGWRQKGFLPVVTNDQEIEDSDHPAEVQQSVLYRFLKQSYQHNIPGAPEFDVLKLLPLQKLVNDDNNSCVATQRQMDNHSARENAYKTVSFEEFIESNPMAGMPLGLPRLDTESSRTVENWLRDGAKGPSAAAQQLLERPARVDVLQAWERDFLNLDSAKARHTARFIYEHVFTAVIAFDESPGEFYELVRSRTASGPVDEIVTELPYQATGVAPFYYRFRKVTHAMVQKTQILWTLNEAKRQHLKKMFLQSDQWPANLSEPEYRTTNQFEYFAQIPGTIRARFMIENSKVIIGAMVQGSVCVGSRATYAISDHFWIWFLKPESDVSALEPQLGLPSWDPMGLAPLAWQPKDAAGRALKASLVKLNPIALVNKLGLTELNSDGIVGELAAQLKLHGVTGIEAFDAVHHFLRTVEAHHIYQAAYERTLRIWLKGQNRNGLGVTDLWNGDGNDPMYPVGKNPNAWLNVTRHEISTTVQFGDEGGNPQSIWVLSYSNFERLYYNLVASFKSWGSIGHRLATWRGMSYVRLEAEDLSISFLPPEHREAIRHRFAQGILASTYNKAFFPHYSLIKMASNPKKWTFFGKKADLLSRFDETPGIQAKTADESVHKLVAVAKDRLKQVAHPVSAAQKVSPARQQWESAFAELVGKSLKVDGKPYPQFFPNVTFIKLTATSGESSVYTVIADRGYKAHNIVFAEDLNREPDTDTLSLYRGFVGAYPNLFLEVPATRPTEFLAQLSSIKTEADFLAFAQTYGVARNSSRFWPFYDWIHEYKAQSLPENDPREQGIVDLSQYLYFNEKL